MTSTNPCDGTETITMGYTGVSLRTALVLDLAACDGATTYSVDFSVDAPFIDLGMAEQKIGGSLGVGFDYWFLLTTGVSFEFEYHMFTVPSGGTMFKYWQVRVDYGIIKF